MAEITTQNGQPVIDYMARDYAGLLKAMRDQIPAKLPEWTDYTSEADFGHVLLELFAAMGDTLSYYQDRIANESFLGTAQTRRSIINHLRLIGYRLSTAAPASARLVLRVPVAVKDLITINPGDAFATRSAPERRSVRFEYTGPLPLTINGAELPLDPDNPAKKIYLPGIPVEEGRLVSDELLGVSDGTPNQRFTLAHRGVILRDFSTARGARQDLLLSTEYGARRVPWSLRESLAFSREQQPDSEQQPEYELEIDDEDRATVRFGDGAFGAIPPKGWAIRATYRVGGGVLGNVGKDSIKTIVGAPQLALLGATVTNPAPATGGADRESIEHAVRHAPRVFRSMRRAVTAADYEALALDYNGVGKVRAVAGGWNVVRLFVAPQGGGQVSDVLEAGLLAHFEDKRPITTIIEIADVDYVPIFVTATIGVQGFYDRDTVRERVRAVAGDLLAFDRVDFAQPVYLSKFYEAIEAVEGVDYVTIAEFRRADQPPGVEPSGKITLGANELASPPDADEHPAYAGGVRVRLDGEAAP